MTIEMFFHLPSFWNGIDVNPSLDQSCSKGMPQIVETKFFNASFS